MIKSRAGETSKSKSSRLIADANLPGTPDKFELQQNDNMFESDDVFKPKKDVPRTPPTKNNMKSSETLNIEKTNQFDMENNSNKRSERQRSESSPELNKNKKRQCDLMGDVSKEDKLQAEIPSGIPEEIILQMFSNLDTINVIAQKIPSDVSCGDQENLKEAHNKLQQLLTMVVFNCSKLEKENIMLKNQVIMNNLFSNSNFGNNFREKSNDPEKETTTSYASIASTNVNREVNKNNVIQATENENWKTPTTVKKYETLIRIENISDPKDALKQFKKEINNKDVGRGFKNIRQTKGGAIIVESFDKDQQQKLKTAVHENNQIKIKESQENDPMFMITGIEKGLSNEEFLKEIERLNSEIVQEIGYTVHDKIKVIGKKQCRNPAKENWILQASPVISKWFLKKGKIFFDLVIVHVQEHINLAMCFKCSGFGHIAKHCFEKECCHKCGEEHMGKDCNEENYKCPNCAKLKLEDLNHSARDQNCPVYNRRLNAFRNNINYQNFLPKK